MYTSEDFIKLTFMSDEEIREEVNLAKIRIEETMDNFKELEETMREENPLLVPNLDILFRQINNIEGYVRQAENLLEEWDSNRHINKMRKNRIKLIDIDIKKSKKTFKLLNMKGVTK